MDWLNLSDGLVYIGTRGLHNLSIHPIYSVNTQIMQSPGSYVYQPVRQIQPIHQIPAIQQVQPVQQMIPVQQVQQGQHIYPVQQVQPTPQMVPVQSLVRSQSVQVPNFMHQHRPSVITSRNNLSHTVSPRIQYTIVGNQTAPTPLHTPLQIHPSIQHQHKILPTYADSPRIHTQVQHQLSNPHPVPHIDVPKKPLKPLVESPTEVTAGAPDESIPVSLEQQVKPVEAQSHSIPNQSNEAPSKVTSESSTNSAPVSSQQTIEISNDSTPVSLKETTTNSTPVSLKPAVETPMNSTPVSKNKPVDALTEAPTELSPVSLNDNVETSSETLIETPTGSTSVSLKQAIETPIEMSNTTTPVSLNQVVETTSVSLNQTKEE